MGLRDLLRRRQTRYVRVTFRDITEPPPKVHGRGYVYRWPLNEPPELGARVLVPGLDGPAWTVIIGLDDATREDLEHHELKDVIRLATPQEVANGEAIQQAAENAWLDMMRRAAGLATRGRPRNRVPDGYPEIPPADGTAPPDLARAHGSAWWRASKSARDDEERKRFENLGHRWYAIQQRGH